jgi:hypothetical protein
MAGILAYNQNDVSATNAIRQWMTLHSTAIPAVEPLDSNTAVYDSPRTCRLHPGTKARIGAVLAIVPRLVNSDGLHRLDHRLAVLEHALQFHAYERVAQPGLRTTRELAPHTWSSIELHQVGPGDQPAPAHPDRLELAKTNVVVQCRSVSADQVRGLPQVE